jgi:hypothetical protein
MELEYKKYFLSQHESQLHKATCTLHLIRYFGGSGVQQEVVGDSALKKDGHIIVPR